MVSNSLIKEKLDNNSKEENRSRSKGPINLVDFKGPKERFDVDHGTDSKELDEIGPGHDEKSNSFDDVDHGHDKTEPRLDERLDDIQNVSESQSSEKSLDQNLPESELTNKVLDASNEVQNESMELPIVENKPVILRKERKKTPKKIVARWKPRRLVRMLFSRSKFLFRVKARP